MKATPNREYNMKWERLPAGHPCHRDHCFESAPAELQEWANGAVVRFRYNVRFLPVGPEDSTVGSPTQMNDFNDPQFERTVELLFTELRLCLGLTWLGCNSLRLRAEKLCRPCRALGFVDGLPWASLVDSLCLGLFSFGLSALRVQLGKQFPLTAWSSAFSSRDRARPGRVWRRCVRRL